MSPMRWNISERGRKNAFLSSQGFPDGPFEFSAIFHSLIIFFSQAVTNKKMRHEFGEDVHCFPTTSYVPE